MTSGFRLVSRKELEKNPAKFSVQMVMAFS